MPRESFTSRQQRTARILRVLDETYPDAHCELDHSNPLELLIATILSAQCTDKQVNIVTASLFQRYKTVADYAHAPLEQLEEDVRRIGLYRNKAKNIKAACQQLMDRHGGKVPATMDELVALPGVGRKTANVVLGNAFDINVGVVVDTHVARLSDRLAMSTAGAPEKIELDLMKLVPQKDWAMLSHWLIWHGRRRCFARNPDCADCEILADCPAGQRGRQQMTAEKTAPAKGSRTKPRA